MRTSPNTSTTFFPDGVMDVHQLLKFDPKAELEGFRSLLNRLGAGQADGYLFACIHGEFDPTTGLFHLHLHSLAGGEMLVVLSRVRKLPAYRSRRGAGEKQKVKIGSQPLDNLPYPLTYIVQSSWPSRWRGEVRGKSVRGEIRGRIPEPFHTAYLLWLDRWSLQDITLMIGLYVGRNGLVLNNRPQSVHE